MKKLSTLLPTMRWIPHDIEPPPRSSKTSKDKPKRSLLSRKPNEPKPNHGALKRRKSVVSQTSVVDEELDARTHMQSQSAFFSKLPLEIRKMVYEYVVGQETVHLLFAKKRFGHFVCPAENHGSDPENRECGCKVLVGGAQCERLSGACVRMLGVCRRM